MNQQEMLGELERLRLKVADLEGTQLRLKETETALRESEERYPRIVETANEGIWAIDAAHCTTFVNAKMAGMLGYAIDEMVGRKVEDFIFQEDLADHEQQMVERHDGRNGVYERRFRRKDGLPLLTLVSATSTLDDQGAFEGAFAMVTDITESKQAEAALRDSEMRYRQMFERNRAVKLLIDPESGDIVDANPAACEFYGYSLDELKLLKITDINMLPRNVVGQKMTEAVGERQTHFFFPHRIASGETRDVEVYSGPVYSKGRNLLYSIIHDITDRKRAEEALRDSEERFRRTFDQAPIGAAMVSLDYRFMRVNEALCRVTGYTSQHLIGIGLQDVTYPDDFAHHVAQARLLASGEIDQFSGEARFIREDGGCVWIHLSVHLIRDSAGNAMYYLPMMEDITEQKRSQELLIQTERFRAVADLASGVAHNFNNLLQIVLGNANLAIMNLESGNVTDIKMGLEQIIESARFGAETVRRLNSFARIRKEDTEAETQVVDLSDIVRQALEMTTAWWKTTPEKKGIKITLKLDLRDACLVTGRKNELFEVVVNLIKNAAEAMIHGGEIRVSSAVSGNDVLLSVQDNGVGIPEQNLNRLFTPFFTTKFEAGTGLGLATAKTIVDNHGGRISVYNGGTRGTIFALTLPRAREASAVPEAPQPLTSKDRRLTVLVIDDMEQVVKMLQGSLSRFGHTVITALSGAQGVTIFGETPIDVVICDLGMPEMNGWEVGKAVAAMCEERATPGVPFILLTGWGGQVKEAEMISACGVGAVLEKPVDIVKLMEVIGKLTSLKADEPAHD